MSANDQETTVSKTIAEKMEKIEQRLSKLEKSKHFNHNNACTESKFDSKKIKKENPEDYLSKPREKRDKNLILFGVGYPEETMKEATNERDKIEVLKIFSAIGFTIESDSLKVERLKPKRTQTEPHPILVRLECTSENVKATDIIRVAKNLKESTDFKHIGISLDLFVEQRMVQKKLVNMRKELNKDLRERIPDASFYYCIKNNKIVKKSKYKIVSDVCKEAVNKLMNEAINEFKPNQINNTHHSSILSLPLLNKVVDAKLQETEFQRIRKLSEKITTQVIAKLDNPYYWSRDTKFDSQHTNSILASFEKIQTKTETDLKMHIAETKDLLWLIKDITKLSEQLSKNQIELKNYMDQIGSIMNNLTSNVSENFKKLRSSCESNSLNNNAITNILKILTDKLT